MKERLIRMVKRFGVIGVVFFFLKGIAWIFFGGAITKFVMSIVDKA